VGRAGLRDVAIARVLADDFAFVRTAVKVEALVRVIGADDLDGKTLAVTLHKDGEVVRQSEITIVRGQRDYPVSFYFTPDRVGKSVYEIATPVIDGEAIADNNSRTFLLRTIRDKIRVLLVAGRPSWDERFLRNLLKHDPNVDLISSHPAHTRGRGGGLPDELSLIPFPTEELFREQLRSFDVMFLLNFNYGPYSVATTSRRSANLSTRAAAWRCWAATSASRSAAGRVARRGAAAGGAPAGTSGDPARLVDLAPFKLQLTPRARPSADRAGGRRQ